MSNETVACLVLSDWHIGELVRKEETEFFGEYNFQIAQRRIMYIVAKFLKWINAQKKKINKIFVLGLGDYISGGIHEELLMNQEFPVFEQVEKCSKLLSKILIKLANSHRQIIFYGLSTDNHGRLFKKPVHKQRALTNFSYPMLLMTKERVKDRKNINFRILNGITEIVTINKHNFLLTHGDTIKAWTGIPFYGIERFKSKEIIRRTACKKRNKRFDYIIMGHWHVPGKILGDVFINGSLIGTTEYDHSYSRVSRPVQIAFLVHTKYGAYNYIEFEDDESNKRVKKKSGSSLILTSSSK